MTMQAPALHPRQMTAAPLHSLPQVRLDATRAELLAYFDNSWALTEMLFAGLASDEAYYRRPYHQLRHPLIFYYGHPVALYINKLRVAGLLSGPLKPEFEALFETGVDEMRWDDLHEGDAHIWPSVAAVREYRAEAYTLIRQLIETHPAFDAPITQDSPGWSLVMGFEHERIHVETSSVLMRELPIELVKKPDAWPDYQAMTGRAQGPKNRMIAMAAGEVTLGKPQDYPTFGWDNEYGHETRSVRAFSASSMLISNAEFHAFVADGGYTDERYWSAEGWAWRRFRNIKWPTFWVPDGPAGLHHYRLRTVFEVIPMQHDWPVCVNFHEAKAYCAWASERENSKMPYRLLTEAEHVALRDGSARGNLGLMTGGESPVDAFGANAQGFYDVFGNVWQWCEDHFHPLAGSKPHPYYDDFSAPCYDGEHQMILGGSFISTGDEASAFARFHFRPHFFQHAGFRIARSEDGNPASGARVLHKNGAVNYETEEMLNRYLHMHYASDDEIFDAAIFANAPRPAVVNLPQRCAELVVKHSKGKGRVLDLGCAVGGSTFALARDFAEVVGIDYSAEFIRTAEALQRTGGVGYTRRDTGSERTALIAQVPADIDRSRVRFEQGDACALPLHLTGFDAVLLANVLCRLPDPAACLTRMQDMHALVKPGGTLVMTTPLSWLPEYTAPERWLKDVAAIGEVLTEFELLEQVELPFMIREHRRKFEYIVTLASVWRRKA